MQKWCSVILAGGQGKRMRSSLPKVFLPILGRPLMAYLLDTVKSLGFTQCLAVFAPAFLEKARISFGNRAEIAIQEVPRGTAQALQSALPFVRSDVKRVLTVYADMPLLPKEIISEIVSFSEVEDADVVFLTALSPSPEGFGRVIRDEMKNPLRVVEEKDCSPQELAIQEVNVGVFAFRKEILAELLGAIPDTNRQREFYLTDVVEVGKKKGFSVKAFQVEWRKEFLNVNCPSDLSVVFNFLREQKIETLWEKGVKIFDPQSVYVDWDTEIEEDAWLYPGVVLEGRNKIGKGVKIGPFSKIVESFVGAKSVVEYSVVEYAHLEEEVSVGPFVHLRPGTKLEKGVKIGNFVEVKNSHLGERTKALHLSYLGDAQIGKEVNIGAGTITCNFDGINKNPTFIDNRAFIGSNNALVAPVKIGEGAYTAAGSTITQNVPPYALGVGRVKQINIEGWAKRKRGEEK
ncbi:MAG: bifunctional UDP-N-acetylglucosamine diphosphorylase/glucosamine-1-phosphate N-acetyltransferase GlmU [Candidatus Caldatribacteriaceae bacterium]